MRTAKTYYLLKRGIALFAAALVFSVSCSGDPLLTDLRTNNLTVVIKGTYESNNPKEWSWPSPIGSMTSKSIVMHPVEADKISSKPQNFMIDITGMSLSGDAERTADFGNYRTTYECGASDNSASFFNGEGITMRNDDVPAGKEYNQVRLYLRKMLFSDALRYNLSALGWEDSIPFITYFEEEKANAFNFNLPLSQYLYDTLHEDDSVNRVYPCKINISNNLVFDPEEEMVLEIRLVIKNFIKLYEYNHLDYSTDKPYIVHYFGISDWLREVQAGDNVSGGNLLAVARTYIKGKTGTVHGTNSGAKYVIGIPENDNIADYIIPDNGTLRSNYIKHSKIPTLPIEATDSVPARLFYYMQTEKFKYDWNQFLKDANDNYAAQGYSSPQALFESEWTKYNEEAEKFKIPPLATYCESDGSYEITNIAPGRYKFYYTANEPVWGELFKGDANSYFTHISDTTINAGDNIAIP